MPPATMRPSFPPRAPAPALHKPRFKRLAKDCPDRRVARPCMSPAALLRFAKALEELTEHDLVAQMQLLSLEGVHAAGMTDEDGDEVEDREWRRRAHEAFASDLDEQSCAETEEEGYSEAGAWASVEEVSDWDAAESVGEFGEEGEAEWSDVEVSDAGFADGVVEELGEEVGEHWCEEDVLETIL